MPEKRASLRRTVLLSLRVISAQTGQLPHHDLLSKICDKTGSSPGYEPTLPPAALPTAQPRGHMTARYPVQNTRYERGLLLVRKVTVTASPCTGCAHHAHSRTGCSRLRRGRLAFATLLPFLRAAVAVPPHALQGKSHPALGQPAGMRGTARRPVPRGRMAYPCSRTREI